MIRSLVGDRTNKKKGNLRIMKTLRCLLASVTPIATAVVLTAASTAFAGGGAECDITFRITTSTALRSASVFVIYQNAPGDFLGQTTSTECTNLTGTVGSGRRRRPDPNPDADDDGNPQPLQRTQGHVPLHLDPDHALSRGR
jgi:hypothetical protein